MKDLAEIFELQPGYNNPGPGKKIKFWKVGAIIGAAFPLSFYIFSLIMNYHTFGDPFYSGEWGYLPMLFVLIPILPILRFLEKVFNLSPVGTDFGVIFIIIIYGILGVFGGGVIQVVLNIIKKK